MEKVLRKCLLPQLLYILLTDEVGGRSHQVGVAKVGIAETCEDISKKETTEVAKLKEETSEDNVPEDDLYESSSEDDQVTEIVKESESGGVGVLDLGGVESESGLGALNLGGGESKCGLGSLNLGGEESQSVPGFLDLGGVADAWRSRPQLAPTHMSPGTNLTLGAVLRKLTHSSASSTSTLPVSPASGFYMDSALSSGEVSRVDMGGSYHLEDFGKREELLFPSTSPVLTSAISSTLFASSISSLRFDHYLVYRLCKWLFGKI